MLLPLFSIRTRRDWGIGEILDLPVAARWLQSAGQRFLQILPPHALSMEETSPYNSRTAFGIDPTYLSIEAIEDLTPLRLEQVLGQAGQQERQRLRACKQVDYRGVRTLKQTALQAAFANFYQHHWQPQTPRAREFQEFMERERDWLEDFVLYIVLKERYPGCSWTTWPLPVRNRTPGALSALQPSESLKKLFLAYLQWIAWTQWEQARNELKTMAFELVGDVSFGVNRESADVWARAPLFRLDLSLGVPPDDYFKKDQDWGLPPYRWSAMEEEGFAWLQARIRHARRLYDLFRLDHLIGYFRMYMRLPEGLGIFEPADEAVQRTRGEAILRVVLEAAEGTRVIGEDLGLVLPFMREVTEKLQITGYRVLCWERQEGGQLRLPSTFPENSVATWSTHDTPPITQWWHEFSPEERREFAHHAGFPVEANEKERTLPLLNWLLKSRSSLALLQVQELLGESIRINTPATVGDHNWVYRLPEPIEDLVQNPQVMQRCASIKEFVWKSGR
ncbi:4-alpha-glucanotransferase [Pajaroellobacter abortibovis]|uniref:4-alpha-glucanotransferase n=1 Tax=Pajaroellobacter abortibovis TaxID=1882918 RepID=A0A1L6MZP1_9BACT|nr:4-alpha-glucanotransferase [Pajaroellobacter abortibovis]